MKSIGTIYTTVSSTVTNDTTSFVEVVESSALVDGTTYYVICHALTSGSLTHLTDKWRLVDRTNSDTVLSNSTLIREPVTADVTQSYCFVGRFTAGSDGGGLAFEQKSSASNWDCKTEYLSMILIDVSNLQESDYFFANDTTVATHTTSYVNRASLTVSEPTSDDTYLMFGWVATGTNNVSNNSQMYMEMAAGFTVELAPFISFEGEDLTEVLGWWICRPYTMTDESTTFTIKTRDDSTATPHNEYLESTIFGLRLNAFENFSKAYTQAEDTTTSLDWYEIQSISITPDLSGDVNVFANSVFRPQGTAISSFERLQIDGTTSPNAVPESKTSCRSNDSTDYLVMPYVTQYSGVAATSATIDLDAKKNTASDIGWNYTSISAFTSAILSIAPINYSSVASETYNSGDAASESFNSGDVASEVNP